MHPLIIIICVLIILYFLLCWFFRWQNPTVYLAFKYRTIGWDYFDRMKANEIVIEFLSILNKKSKIPKNEDEIKFKIKNASNKDIFNYFI